VHGRCPTQATREKLAHARATKAFALFEYCAAMQRTQIRLNRTAHRKFLLNFFSPASLEARCAFQALWMC
jgi:hypothetical protein